jgi:hypothetical protein
MTLYGLYTLTMRQTCNLTLKQRKRVLMICCHMLNVSGLESCCYPSSFRTRISVQADDINCKIKRSKCCPFATNQPY